LLTKSLQILQKTGAIGVYMLEVQNLEKSFGGLTAVDRCSLTVEEGSITGLIGPNGAGKTTLFNLITGHYKPDWGKIFFQGQAIEGLAPHQIFRKKLYRTFQITREFAQMSVRRKDLEYLVSAFAGEKTGKGHRRKSP
jgi:branched-chain amino acid transport system ATP-binding protein